MFAIIYFSVHVRGSLFPRKVNEHYRTLSTCFNMNETELVSGRYVLEIKFTLNYFRDVGCLYLLQRRRCVQCLCIHIRIPEEMRLFMLNRNLNTLHICSKQITALTHIGICQLLTSQETIKIVPLDFRACSTRLKVIYKTKFN